LDIQWLLSIAQALVDAGVFDYSVHKPHKYPIPSKYKYPKLKELDIDTSIRPKYISNIAEYRLEAIYSSVFDTTPNWEEICRSTIHVDTIRRLAQKELGVLIPGDKTEVCTRILSIIRNKELAKELPELTQEFLLYPGTKEDPRVQYRKYMFGPELWKQELSKVDISKYFTEVDEICDNPERTSRDAYQLVLDIGIQQYVDLDQDKMNICKVIKNYLKVIQEERIL